MRKIILFLLQAVSILSQMQASIELEARAAFFLPQDSLIREIYGKSITEYELEASTTIDCFFKCPCNLEAFANLGYYQQNGTSTCSLEHDRTTIRNWALNLGLKYYIDTAFCFRPYLGFGVGVANVEFHDESEFVKRHINQWGASLLAKSGIKYDITCNLFLDLFVDYSYHFFRFNKQECASVRNVNTGGLMLGLGLGYQF